MAIDDEVSPVDAELAMIRCREKLRRRGPRPMSTSPPTESIVDASRQMAGEIAPAGNGFWEVDAHGQWRWVIPAKSVPFASTNCNPFSAENTHPSDRSSFGSNANYFIPEPQTIDQVPFSEKFEGRYAGTNMYEQHADPQKWEADFLDNTRVNGDQYRSAMSDERGTMDELTSTAEPSVLTGTPSRLNDYVWHQTGNEGFLVRDRPSDVAFRPHHDTGIRSRIALRMSRLPKALPNAGEDSLAQDTAILEMGDPVKWPEGNPSEIAADPSVAVSLNETSKQVASFFWLCPFK
jgi:hypothetical protein